MAKISFIGKTFENLGLEYLSAALKEKGHRCELYIDNDFFKNTYIKSPILSRIFATPKSNLKKHIEKHKPDLIALTALTDTFLTIRETAAFIKEHFDIPIVLGGMHATLVPDFISKDIDIFDYICIGEGEKTLEYLVEYIEGKTTKLPKNIITKNTEQQRSTADLLPPVDLNKLPFPDKDIYYRKFKGYQQEYLIMTARGCPYSCNFCCNDIWQTYYGKDFLRRRTVINVIEELKSAKSRYDINFVWFMDDCFTMDKKWIKEFSPIYKKEIDIPFFCYSTPALIDDETAKLLKSAGCHEIAIGVESLNPHILEKLNRPQYIEHVAGAITTLKTNDIFTATENIVYLPDETKQDILNTALFYAKTKPDLVLFSYLKLFPKTKLTAKYLQEKRITKKQMEDIFRGKGNSLATGGNTGSSLKHTGPINLMLLSIFMPYIFTKAIIQYKLYALIIFPPSLTIKIIRLFKAYAPFKRKSYDAGLKTGLRLLLHLIRHPIKPFK